MSADYGFDEEKHAQTNGDMDEGGTALNKSNDATSSLNGAQTVTRWTDEQGAQDFRNSAVRFFSSVDEMLADALQSDPSVAVASSTAGTTSAPSAAPSAQPDDAPTAAGAMPEF